MKVSLLTTTGALETTTLNSELFVGEVNKVLMAQAVRVYQATARQGTSKTKTRSDVSRTKKKWFKQKHTGNARHGARSSNIFVGGGVSHGPTGTQNWKLAMPQGMRRQALRSVLTHQAPNIIMTEGFSGDNKAIRNMLKEVISPRTLTLIILPTYDEKIIKALRNMPTVRVVTSNRVNVMDMAVADKVIVTAEAIKNLEYRIQGKQIQAPAKVAVVKEVAVPKATKPVKSITKSSKTATKVARPATKKAVTKKK